MIYNNSVNSLKTSIKLDSNMSYCVNVHGDGTNLYYLSKFHKM